MYIICFLLPFYYWSTVLRDKYFNARKLSNNIIFRTGKTYHALKKLSEADPLRGGGLYCGPLRLLALEIYENLNRNGVYTSLRTGQEQRQVPGASHISCTLEMVPLEPTYDVAVIDEIQMIADQSRGYAWTRALLGLVANEVHVCGGLEAAPLVQRLVESSGDEFILKTYERLSPLHVAESSLLGDYSKVQPGDCVVAFSKVDIFSIRKAIENKTPYKCAIIYGQLPPETRSMQARLFNEENTGYDILVASDAIGMGLNLNIRRIVFHTTVKGGKKENNGGWLDESSIKQIAGRAGRLSSNYKFGEVTAWQEIDLAYIRAVMSSGDIPSIPAAGTFPTVGQIELFTSQYQKSLALKVETYDEDEDLIDESLDADILLDSEETTPKKNKPKERVEKSVVSSQLSNLQLARILDLFKNLSKIDGRFFLCDYSTATVISNWLHSIPLSVTDKFIFSTAPVSTRDDINMNILYQFASAYALGR